jgi:hypothetical protein
VLRKLTSDGPVLVAIDDAQWLDPPSASALEFALRRLDDRPVRLVVSRRADASRFSSNHRLMVGRRDCTALVGGMAKQVEAIRKAVGQPLFEEFALQVHPALCFVAAE